MRSQPVHGKDTYASGCIFGRQQMNSRNLRHLRAFLDVARTGSISIAAEQAGVSQPAVSQAIGKLEKDAGGRLFERTRAGLKSTARGDLLAARVNRAFAFLDPAFKDIAPRLRLTATAAQLQALVAVVETENFTLAARQLGVSQPTVHRAVTQLESEAGRKLLERTSFGMSASRQATMLTRATLLAFRELDQAAAEIAEFEGRIGGRIVIGALPLSRTALLPNALLALRRSRPLQQVEIIDGPYDELLTGLRRGDIDVIVGALRNPAPIGDVVQERLFLDTLAILARPGHPLVGKRRVPADKLAQYPWVVPRNGAPTRIQFDELFLGIAGPQSLIESGSILLMRAILANSDHLGCISALQASAEVSNGLLALIDMKGTWEPRPIGITNRENWKPTAAQAEFLDLLRHESKSFNIA